MLNILINTLIRCVHVATTLLGIYQVSLLLSFTNEALTLSLAILLNLDTVQSTLTYMVPVGEMIL